MSRTNLVLNPYQKRHSCCYKCEDRTAECHGVCDKYKKELEENERRYTKARVDQELNIVDAARATSKINWFRKAGCRK